MQEHKGGEFFHRPYFLYLKGMRVTPMPAWKHRPALRLLLPFCAGIITQWYAALPLWPIILAAILSCLSLLCHQLLPLRLRFGAVAWQGLSLNGLLIAAGALFCHQADVRNDASWIGAKQQPSSFIAEISTDPIEKANSVKAQARVLRCFHNGHWEEASGAALLYFEKGSAAPQRGQYIQFQDPLQRIRNSGNPGAFDFARWNLFQGVTHQAFVRSYSTLPGKAHHPLDDALASLQQWVLRALRKNIPGKEAQGLAEALLIGYKNDLDQELTATYARTGVVHIIAISGMHLALVYLLLMALTRPFGAPRLRLLRLAIVLGGLWGFSLLAGGGPSVLRSALMFSLLAIGGLLGRKGNSLNSLLLAALLLLLINPFWLWDVGFQLSFTAVGGIILFYRPIYQRYNTHNKLLDFIWKGAAVSLAAQVLTTPLSLYHFHQFPLLFLVANLLAVPLSGVLVYALIALCALSWWPAAAAMLGKACSWMIALLNGWIERVDRVPFALWDGLSINALQTALLYGLIAALSWALLQRRPRAMRWAALSTLLFLTVRGCSFYNANRQQRLIVYQVPKHSTVEIQYGRTLLRRSDATLIPNSSLYNFHLKPAHTLARSVAEAPLPSAFLFAGKVVAQIGLGAEALPDTPVDLLVVARLARPEVATLAGVHSVVLDASVTRRNAARWKQMCAAGGIACHDVQESGAFVWEP
ncbi:MAG: ComEC family competence protein [Chitinophagaceae bacterium]|nr:MAG: ComEC family competence protein [Chitinophagaceae bacterium]